MAVRTAGAGAARLELDERKFDEPATVVAGDGAAVPFQELVGGCGGVVQCYES